MERALIAIALCLAAAAASANGRWHCDGVAPRHVAACQDYAARYISYREGFEQRRQEYADQKKARDKARAQRRESGNASRSADPGKVK